MTTCCDSHASQSDREPPAATPFVADILTPPVVLAPPAPAETLYNHQLVGQFICDDAMGDVVRPLFNDMQLDRDGFSEIFFVCGLENVPVLLEGQQDLVTVPGLIITSTITNGSERGGARLSRQFVSIPVFPDPNPADQKTYDLLIHVGKHELHPHKVVQISDEALISAQSRAMSEIRTNPETSPVLKLHLASDSSAGERAPVSPAVNPARPKSTRRTMPTRITEPARVVKDFSGCRCSLLTCAVRTEQPMEKKCESKHCKKKSFHEQCASRAVGETISFAWYCCTSRTCSNEAANAAVRDRRGSLPAATVQPTAHARERSSVSAPAASAVELRQLTDRATAAENDVAVRAEQANTAAAQMQLEKQRVETEKQKGLSFMWEASANGARALFEYSNQQQSANIIAAERRADLDRKDSARRERHIQNFALQMTGGGRTTGAGRSSRSRSRSWSRSRSRSRSSSRSRNKQRAGTSKEK